MDQSHFETLLEEVQNDIAKAEQTIEELRPLVSYLTKKLSGEGDGGGGDPTPPPPKPKASKSKAASKPAKKEPEPQQAEAGGGGGGGMQTVEFGPDGFPNI